MRAHTVFLRKDCTLPNHLDPLEDELGCGWMRVVDVDAPVFDSMIRQAGWHFMWAQESCQKQGFGFAHESAVQRALLFALDAISPRFNAAELCAVQVKKCLGLHFATVLVESRQIQQETSLEFPNDL